MAIFWWQGGGRNSLVKWGKFLVVAALVLSSGFFVGNVRAAVDFTPPVSPNGTELWGGIHDITWSATGSPGDTVDIIYSTDGFTSTTHLIATNLLFSPGTFSWNTAGVPDGSTYRVRVQSHLNPVIYTGSAADFTIDNMSPAIPTVGTVPSLLRGGQILDITWTPTSDAHLGSNPIKIEYASDGAIFTTVAGNELNDGSYTWTVPSDNTATARIKITATDLAGNTSFYESNIFTIDSTAPSIPTGGIIGTTVQGGDDTIVIHFSEPVVANDGVWTDGNEFTSIKANGTAIDMTGAIYSYDGASNVLNITLGSSVNLKNGEFVSVTPATDAIKDLAGNYLSSTEVVGTTPITGDIIAPSVALAYSISGRPVRDADTLTITATFSETISGAPKISIDTTGTDLTPTDMTATGNALVWTFSYDVPAGSDGTATVTVNITDLAGNPNSAATNNTFTIDNTAPTVLGYTINGSGSNYVFNPGSVDIVVNANEPVNWSSFRIYNLADDTKYKDFNVSGVDNQTSITRAWNGGLSPDGTPPFDGIYGIRVHFIDLAGNDSGFIYLTDHTITVDTHDPTIDCLTSPATDAVYKPTNLPHVQFTPNDSGTPVICSYALNGSPISLSACAVGVAVNEALSGLGDGRQNLTITVTDAAGNHVSQSVSFVFDNDNTLTVGAGADFATIQAAVNAATGGETIRVLPGIYTENQIAINKNLTIRGDDKLTTIVRPSSDTAMPQGGTNPPGDASGWFVIGPGANTTISGLTLNGSGRAVGIAILSHGAGSIDNNIITNIRFGAYRGFGIYLWNATTGVTNNTLSNIERVGIILKGASTNADVSENDYTGKGIGDWLDYGIELGAGAHATITGNTIRNNVGVAATDGSTSAGIYITTYWGPGTQATITDNAVSNSTDGIAVGYDGVDTSIVVAHRNRLTGNVKGINSTHPLVNGTSNWWGSLTGPTHSSNPGGSGDAVSDHVTYSPWCTNVACSEGTLGSSDPLNRYDVAASANSAVTPGPITLTITAKDASGITRVNDVSQITLTANRPVSFMPDFILNFVNGIKNADVSYSGVGDVNVHIDGGVSAIKTINFAALSDTSDHASPPAPAITTLPATVNADFYTINGTAGADLPTDSSRTIRLFNGGTLAGTTILDVGQTAWSIVVSLNQEASNVFKATSTDASGNTSADSNTVTIIEHFNDTASLAVTGISSTQSLATANDSWEHGWHWTFNVTVPTVESSLSMQFSDWTSGANVIPVSGNTRFYSAQSNYADAGNAVTITEANTYTGPIQLTGDLDPATPGRQIQITVETKVPPSAAGGSYSASYGVSTSTP